MGEYWTFDKAVADAGVKVGGEALQVDGVPTRPAAWPRQDHAYAARLALLQIEGRPPGARPNRHRRR